MIQAVIDSGSTKADWRVFDQESLTAFSTQGLNPYFVSRDEIITIINQQVFPKLTSQQISRIHFYGAGCGTAVRRKQVADALNECFPDASIVVDTDLLAAARALLKNVPGFTVILGTGTNSGLYDGKQIVRSIDSLGYFLGDEGSGASIGKKLLRDYLRGYFPPDLQRSFALICPMNREQVLEQLYSKPSPGSFLGSLAPFAAENRAHPYLQQLIKESFSEFFLQLITHYENYQQYPICCAGSVSYIFKDILMETANDFGAKIHKFIQSPIDDLVVYHQTY
ncbi:MAG: N-acetylglucosamine kinase [Chitinophagales bacterium]